MYADIDMYYSPREMPPVSAAADVFTAIAEPRRRAILDLLAGGERPVNDLVAELAISQPQVSKHLRVLREVGAVTVRESGRQRLYRVDPQSLKPVGDWVRRYEQMWEERFESFDAVLEEMKGKEAQTT